MATYSYKVAELDHLEAIAGMIGKVTDLQRSDVGWQWLAEVG